MARAVGIDIGSKGLKILELETAGNQFQVRHFFNREIAFAGDDPAEMALLVEPLRQIFRENRLEQNHVAISVPTQDCILREITLDFVQDEHIKKIIKYEAEKYLQSYPIEDVIIDFYKLQVISQTKSKVFFTAVPKKVIAQRLDILAKCDIDPITIDIDIMALINLARLSPQVAGKDTVVIVDFGAVSTKLAVLYQGELRYVRAIRVGASISEGKNRAEGKATTEERTALPDIEWELEKQLIISLPVPDGIELGRMVLVKKDRPVAVGQKSIGEGTELFKRLLREIKRTMLNLDVVPPVELICLTGGSSQLPGIAERFEESFQIETILLKFPDKIQVPGEIAQEVARFGGIALGLALEILDKNYRGMSFRREEFQYTNRFELLKIPLATLVSLLFLFVLAWAYYFQNQRLLHQRRYKQLTDKAVAIWERSISSEVPATGDFDVIETTLSKMDEELQKRVGIRIPPGEDGFQRWRAIFAGFLEVRKSYYLIIKKFSLNPENAVIEGNLEDPGALDSLRRVMLTMDDPSIKDLVKPKETGGEILGEARESPDKNLKWQYRFVIKFKRKGENE